MVLLLAVALAAPLAGGDARTPPSLTEREKALHVLNRLAFGPRPGDVERVLRTGVAAYVDEQLAPDRVADGAVSARLAPLTTLGMSGAQLFDNFERPIREARRRRREEQRKDAPGGVSSLAATDELERIREMVPPESRPRRVVEELAAARIVRAAFSERQLNEVMVDFWMNHFNVYAAKGLDRVFVTSFERDVVRPLLWGRFEDLLLATAKSPAMLFYLDNARSVAEEANRPRANVGGRAYGRAFFALGAARGLDPEMMLRAQANPNAPKGINENYARELMELHTLGVNGGYTQKDVTELARVLTGWSIDPQRGEFLFRARLHDVAPKTVLGRTFPPGGGIEEGESMLRTLARHPATARHIAFQLCQRLVADDPPAGVVDRVSKRFLSTGGNLRETVRAVVTSPEFFDPKFYRAKVKSPFEYAVSAVRAAGGETDGRMPIVRAIAQMGEPLYLCQPPTGYSDVADAWVNTGALVARLNFALALAGNRIPGTHVEVERLVSADEATDSARSVAVLSNALVGQALSKTTLEMIQKRMEVEDPDNPPGNSRQAVIAGLILGSPEFQRQ